MQNILNQRFESTKLTKALAVERQHPGLSCKSTNLIELSRPAWRRKGNPAEIGIVRRKLFLTEAKACIKPRFMLNRVVPVSP